MNGLISQWKDKAFFHLIHPVRQDRPRCCPKDISKPQVCVWFPEPESRKPHVLLKSTSIFISIVESRSYSHICPQDSRARQRYVHCAFFPVSPSGTYAPWAQHTVLCSHSQKFPLSEGTKKTCRPWFLLHTHPLTRGIWDSGVMHAQCICEMRPLTLFWKYSWVTSPWTQNFRLYLRANDCIWAKKLEMSLDFLFLSICFDSGHLISDRANSTVIPIL